jgi:hypothetical protein
MSRARPTAREVFFGTERLPSEQNVLERQFFERVFLPNGTIKTTWANRLDDVNEFILPFLPPAGSGPLHVADVAVSSGVSTLEWWESLSTKFPDLRLTATDVMFDSTLLSVGFGLEALVGPDGSILHFDLFGRGAPPRAEGVAGMIATAARTLFRLVMSCETMLTEGRGAPSRLLPFVRREHVKLVTRRVQAHPGIRLIEDNLLGPPKDEFRQAFDVVRAANILNVEYFDRFTLVRMIRRIKISVRPGGFLLVCKTASDGVNSATLFTVKGQGFEVVSRLGRGSDIEELVLGLEAVGREAGDQGPT